MRTEEDFRSWPVGALIGRLSRREEKIGEAIFGSRARATASKCRRTPGLLASTGCCVEV